MQCLLPRDLETITKLTEGMIDAFEAAIDTMSVTDYERFRRIDEYLHHVLVKNYYGHSEEQRRSIGEKGLRIQKRLLSRPQYGVPQALLSDEHLLQTGERKAEFRRRCDAADLDQATTMILEEMVRLAKRHDFPIDEAFAKFCDLLREQDALENAFENPN